MEKILWILLTIGMSLFGLDAYFSQPVVHWFASQNRCVQVIQDGINIGCDNIPEQYERIWVK